MGDLVNFSNGNESAIVIERTENFLGVARKVSDFINGLPLSNEDNDCLISLIIEQIKEAEKGAFLQGMSLGVKLNE